MKAPPRFLFDECLGKPLMERLASVVQSEFEFVHICDIFKSGEKDQDWVPTIAGNQRVILTADTGRNSVKNDKLPSLCVQHELTHVLLGGRFHSQKAEEKFAVLRELWPDIEATLQATAGTRFKVQFVRSKAGAERFVLKSVPG